MLVGHASRHASFAGNRDRPLEQRTIGRTWTVLFHLFAPSVHLPRRVSSFLLPLQVSPLVPGSRGPCARSRRGRKSSVKSLRSASSSLGARRKRPFADLPWR